MTASDDFQSLGNPDAEKLLTRSAATASNPHFDRRLFLGGALAVGAAAALQLDRPLSAFATTAEDFYSAAGCPFAYSDCYGPTFHTGRDYEWPRNTAIPSPAAGTIVETGITAIHGNYVSVWYPAVGMYLQFCHMDNPGLQSGSVAKGTTLGYVGSLGEGVTGPHLHLAASTAPSPGNGSRVDPVPLVATLLGSPSTPNESDEMSIMIFKAAVPGVGQHYFVMSTAGVHMGLEISANPANKQMEDIGIGLLAYIAKLQPGQTTYDAPVFSDYAGWPNVKAMAAKVCGMPSDYPLAPGTPFVAASYFNTNA